MNGELAAGPGAGGGSGRAPPPDGRGRPLLPGAHSAMAPDPSGRPGHLGLLLLLACCLAATWADPFPWLWFSEATMPKATPASVPQATPAPVPPGSSPEQRPENTTAHVDPWDGATDAGEAPASPEPRLERLDGGQGQGPALPTAPPESRDPKEENIAGVGAKILNVALGIQRFIRLWDDTTHPESSAGGGTPASPTPTDPLTTPGPSSTLWESGTTLWLSSGAPSSPDTQRTEAGTQPLPTQPPPSPGGPLAPFRAPSVPPPAPGRASLSPAPGGAPPWGSQLSPGWSQELDGKGLLPVAARPGQQHRHPDVRRPPLLPLVTGSPGAHGPSALSSGAPATLSYVALAALIGDGGAWLPHVANSSGPGLAHTSAQLGATGRCLPLPPSLAICSRLGIGRVWLPNHLHHGSGEEVQAAARAWGALLQTRCHRFLAWFFCLLLAPPCGPGPAAPPPCRQFCETLEDACWSHLDGGGLPVPCASLPAREDGHCVFIGPAAGNPPAGRLPFLLAQPGGPGRGREDLHRGPSRALSCALGRQRACAVSFAGGRLGTGEAERVRV